MKIAIIGGGICGLSTYLNLQKHLVANSRLQDTVDITIYETHILNRDTNQRKDGIPSSGGGYGLAPNGMASLRRLDPEVHDRILRGGFPSPKPAMKSARGWTLGTLPFVDTRGLHPEACVMVLRQVVLDALYEHVPESAVVHKKVVEVVDGAENATVKLEDGEELKFDLVIGADGVWSKTRRAVLGEKYDEFAAVYKGLFTVGGFVSSDYLPTPPETGESAHSQTIMIFGPNGFFAYSPYTTAQDVHATDEHIRGNATLKAGEWAFWWSRSEQENPEANPDDEVVKDELRKTHKLWKDPTIHKILEVSEVPLKIPTWVLPKLPKWAGKRVVLAGDAAHALPSSSGQGVSQAIEDAEALSLLLAHNFNGTVSAEALEKTFSDYTKVRKAHVEKILDNGNRAGDTSREMGPVAEIAMYSAFWLFLKLSGGSLLMKPVRDYDVVAEVEKIKRLS